MRELDAMLAYEAPRAARRRQLRSASRMVGGWLLGLCLAAVIVGALE